MCVFFSQCVCACVRKSESDKFGPAQQTVLVQGLSVNTTLSVKSLYCTCSHFKSSRSDTLFSQHASCLGYSSVYQDIM